MKHYLKTLEETIRQQWDQKSLCDYEGDSFTYADVATSIEQFRIFLVEAGITKRSKIAICARNCARWAMIFWDINVNECVAVPLLADFHPNSITTFTHHSDSVLLFTDKEIWDKLNPGQMPNLRAAINVKDRSMLWHRDELVAEAWENREKAFAQKHPTGFTRAQVSYPSDNMDKLAIINYTSGTTGNPKGVMLTYGAISDTDAFSNSHFPNQPGETVVSMLPMAHMYGLAIEFIHPNVDGVTVYFLGKTPSPTTLLKAMQEVKPYMVVTVPLVMEKVYANSIKPALDKMKWLMAIPQARKAIYKLVRKKVLTAFGGQVRGFIMGGAALKPEAEECFSKIHLPYTVGYGMTEACPLLGFEWCTESHQFRRSKERPRGNTSTGRQPYHRLLQESRSQCCRVYRRRLVPYRRLGSVGRRQQHLHPWSHQVDDPQLFRPEYLSRGIGGCVVWLPICERIAGCGAKGEVSGTGISRDPRRLGHQQTCGDP